MAYAQKTWLVHETQITKSAYIVKAATPEEAKEIVAQGVNLIPDDEWLEKLEISEPTPYGDDED